MRRCLSQKTRWKKWMPLTDKILQWHQDSTFESGQIPSVRWSEQSSGGHTLKSHLLFRRERRCAPAIRSQVRRTWNGEAHSWRRGYHTMRLRKCSIFGRLEIGTPRTWLVKMLKKSGMGSWSQPARRVWMSMELVRAQDQSLNYNITIHKASSSQVRECRCLRFYISRPHKFVLCASRTHTSRSTDPAHFCPCNKYNYTFAPELQEKEPQSLALEIRKCTHYLTKMA
mmetsp:Transcript_12782/g.29746  ORF Transcript_12782/g.29746 Transcript_12782/m.29746 type:complete len:227 (+) Transcript_12782:1655-2335(+)